MSSNFATGMERPVGASSGQEASQSAVSWAAIFAGALAAIAIVLVLATLGAGIGLTSISPWANSGVSATTFGVSTAIGLIVVQWLASAGGGFITGRLRTKWAGVHTHEVFFRDTAHGFLTWALATLVGTMLLASAASSVISGGVRATATVAGGAAQAAGQIASQAAPGISGYDVDTLFRSERPDPNADLQGATAQASRILTTSLANGDMSAADRAYLTQIISARTGVTPADAQKRIDDVTARAKAAAAKAKETADAARKAAAQFAIFSALSMLIGAFIACASAAYGGSLRDDA
jgi:hypothetical protein